jgi:uncharacterized protein
MNLQETCGFKMIEHFTYTSIRGHIMGLSLYGADLPKNAATVVYLHGFKGFKDWGFTPYVGARFAAAGIKFLAMNFSHNGIGHDPLEFTELERFRDNTFSLELDEALEVITQYHEGKLFGVQAGTRMGLLGHSRGGGIALLASGHPAITSICTWAAVSTFARYPQQVIDLWQQQGYLDVPNARTGQNMQLGLRIHEDLMAHMDGRLSLPAAVARLQKPLCIIHGDQDEAVSDDDARAIFEWADRALAELHIIGGGTHTFGAKHPFVGTTPHLEDVLGHTLQFFTRHLLASL